MRQYYFYLSNDYVVQCSLTEKAGVEIVFMEVEDTAMLLEIIKTLQSAVNSVFQVMHQKPKRFEN